MCHDSGKVDKMTGWHPFCPVWGDLEKVGKNPGKSDRITAFGRSEAGKGGAENLRSKMVQVKGVMPP